MDNHKPNLPVADAERFKRQRDELLAFIKNADVSSGVCCCGDSMKAHANPMHCGHSPVDMWDHSVMCFAEEIERSDLAPLAAPTDGARDRDLALEEAAQLVMNGSFLHDQSPAKKFAREVVAAIRRLKSSDSTGSVLPLAAPAGQQGITRRDLSSLAVYERATRGQQEGRVEGFYAAVDIERLFEQTRSASEDADAPTTSPVAGVKSSPLGEA